MGGKFNSTRVKTLKSEEYSFQLNTEVMVDSFHIKMY